jgi:hypothetical protein
LTYPAARTLDSQPSFRPRLPILAAGCGRLTSAVVGLCDREFIRSFSAGFLQIGAQGWYRVRIPQQIRAKCAGHRLISKDT